MRANKLSTGQTIHKLAKTSDVISQEYSDTNSYAVGDYCIKNNILYKFTTTKEANTTWDVSLVTPTTVDAEISSVNSKITTLGERYSANIGNVSIPSGTTTNVGSITLPAGIYMISAELRWPINANGHRAMVLSNSSGLDYLPQAYAGSNCVSGISECSFMQNTMYFVVHSSETTYNFFVYQNSGSTLGCELARINARRIGF